MRPGIMARVGAASWARDHAIFLIFPYSYPACIPYARLDFFSLRRAIVEISKVTVSNPKQLLEACADATLIKIFKKICDFLLCDIPISTP